MKNIFKIIGFTAGVILLIWGLSWIFNGAKWVNKGYIADRDARIAGMDAEVPGQIDVLNVGDSLCNVGMTPMELYRDYGYTAFNMGRDLQKPLESLFYIRQAVKRQPIKVILWEAHNLFKDESIITSGSMLFSEYFKYKFQFIKYHYIWKNWLEGPGIRKYFKGPIHTKQKLQFKMALDYCRKNNIKLVLYSGVSAKSYDIRLHNAIIQFAQECGVDYLDANYDVDKVYILADECGLTDHRGDPAYRNWDDLLPAYEQELKDMEGTSYPRIEENLKKNR